MAGGGMSAGGYEGIMGGTLGGIGDIIAATKHKNLQFPGASDRTKHLRRQARQLLDQARQTIEGSGNLQQQLSLQQLHDLGYDFDVSSSTQDPQYQATLDQLHQAQGMLNQQQQLQAALKAAKPGSAKKAIRTQLQALNKQIKGMPSLDQLQRQVSAGAANPYTISNVRRQAPTVEDQLQQQFQDAASQRALGAVKGDVNVFDPVLAHQLDLQQQTLNNQLRASLGEDYAASTPGSQALSQFGTYKANQIAQSQNEETAQLRSVALGGRMTLDQLTGMRQDMGNKVPAANAGYGTDMANIAGMEPGLEQPDQFDRSGGMSANTANWQYGDKWAHGLQQSGDRWIQASHSGTGGEFPPPQQG
jgi:hypothetical protein